MPRALQSNHRLLDPSREPRVIGSLPDERRAEGHERAGLSRRIARLVPLICIKG
jgi:hypothetical protein